MNAPESIFISYFRADVEFVQKLAIDLQETGASIWYNEFPIKEVISPSDFVQRTIKSASIVIAIFSPEAVKSAFVMDYVSYAIDTKKRILPVMVSQCELPFRLRGLQYVDFMGDYQTGLNNLLVALGLRVQVPLALQLIKDNKKTRSIRLDLSNCEMTEIPEEIGELVWLEELIISGKRYYDLQQHEYIATKNSGEENSFTTFPPTVKKLKSIKKLVIRGGEKLSDLTDISFIKDCVHLVYLDISHTRVTDISALSKLQKLTWLNVRDTSISDLAALSSLVNLYCLYMSDTAVTDILALSSLSGLNQLYMGGNPISDISTVSDLVKLEILEVKSCPIKDIAAVSDLVNLRVLDFSYTGVNNISPLEKLQSLQRLLFDFTEVSDISAIVNLKTLANVSFERCGVENLIDLAGLERLEKFDCKGNPIADCPADVYETGDAKQLRAYFNAKKAEEASKAPLLEIPGKAVNKDSDTDLRRDVKLIVLGNSNAGKTNLVNYLETGLFTGNRKTTHGLEVHRWIPDKERFAALKDIAVSIWDFGGQEYYHEAYRLFLSSNAVYLLLWCKESDRNSRMKTCLNDNELGEPLEHFEINYWLDTIQHYTGNSSNTTGSTTPEVSPTDTKKAATEARLIAVQNKVDDIEHDKKRIAQDLHEKYGISDSFHISLLKGSDTSNLQQNKRLNYFLSELESAILNNADIEKPPAKWQQIRSAILSLKDGNTTGNPFQKVLGKDPWIKLADFHKACKSLAPDLTEDELYTLPRWLDKGGVVVYFPHIPALANKIFLRPDSLAAKIYQILSEKVRLKGGEFSANELFTKSEKEEKSIFLELTKQLDLVFPHPVKTSGEYYLAPQYLPDNHPIEDLFKIASQGAWQSQLWIKVPLFYYKKILHGLLLHFASEKETECRYFWKHGIMFVNKGLRVLIKGIYPNSLQPEGIILFGVEYDVKKREALQKKIFNQVLQLLSTKSTDGKSGTSGDKTASEPDAKSTDPKTFGPVVDIKVSYDGENYISYNYLLDNSDEPKVKADDSKIWFVTHNFAAILPSTPQKAKRVFLSYSHQNTKWLTRLRTHLSGIRRAKLIETWDDKEILPGDQWDGIIKKNLEEADIYILLLSADFIASEYIWNEELKTAFRNLKERNAVLIPILFEPLDLGGLSEISEATDKSSYKISDFDIIPKIEGGKLQAVSLWQNQEEALALIAERIRDAIQKR